MKTLFKIFLIFFTVGFFHSCEKDNNSISNKNSEFLKGFHYSNFNSLKSSEKLRSSAKKYFKNEDEKQNTNLQDFTIDTLVVQTLASETYISYTFIAKMNTPDSTKLHNYILTYYNDNRVHEMLVSYPRISGGGGFTYDMENIIAKPIDGDVSLFKTTACNGYPVTSWVETCVDYDCGYFGGDGSHGPGQACDNGSVYAMEICTGAYVEDCIEFTDNDEDPSGGDDGGGGGAAGNPDAIAIIPLDECETGSAETDENGNCFIIDDDEGVLQGNPCANLDSLLDNEDIKNKIASLKSDEVLNLDYETGFILKTDDSGNVSGTPVTGSTTSPTIEVRLAEVGQDPDGSVSGFIHTHYNGLLPSFSIEDIKALNGAYQWRNYRNKPLKDLTAMVVTQSGVFALVIDDISVFETEGRKLQTSEFSSIKEDVDEQIKRNTETNYDVSIRNLIDDVLPNYGLKLYKASEDLSSWSEVKPQTTNTTRITTEPCN